jgi:hypothetical protein
MDRSAAPSAGGNLAVAGKPAIAVRVRAARRTFVAELAAVRALRGLRVPAVLSSWP